MSEFGQLITLVVTGMGTTISLCVWLVKQQNKQAADSQRELVGMLKDQIKEQNEIQRDLQGTMQELSLGIRTLGERLASVEATVEKAVLHQRTVSPSGKDN